MRNARRTFLVISIVLFGWLLAQRFTEIDLIPNYSRALASEDISRVDNFNDINKLKEFTKSKIYHFQRINKERSDTAYKQMLIIFILIAIQLFLYVTANKLKNPSSILDKK